MRAHERGLALPFVLGILLILGLLLVGIVAAFRGAARDVGETNRIRSGIAGIDSLFEQARARLMADPWHTLAVEGLDAEWSDAEPCLLGLEAEAKNVTTGETWVVTAINRFVVFADESADIAPGASLDGIVFEGAARAFGETDLVDAAVYFGDADEEIEADTIGPLVIESVMLVRPLNGGSVRLHDVTIFGGVVIIEGDAVISGDFSGTPREGWPLLVVSGRIEADTHAESWEWEGVIAGDSDVLLHGPGRFSGTVVGRRVVLDENLSGGERKTGSIRGLEPRIKRRSRVERWR